MRKRTKQKLKLILVAAICLIWLLHAIPVIAYIWISVALLIFATIYLAAITIFKSEKYIDSRGYVVLRKSNELEHRYMAKQVFSRDLKSNEVVHHINGNKADNSIENLCLMDSEKHELFHSWLSWKKNKSGRYPPIKDQKRILKAEYDGQLLENHVSIKKAEQTSSALVPNSDRLNEAHAEPQNINAPSIESPNELEIQQRLLAELKKMRRQLAADFNIPVYMVFDNKTLLELSEKMPETEQELLKIRGVGPVKVRMYGSVFLSLISQLKKQSEKSTNKNSDSA